MSMAIRIYLAGRIRKERNRFGLPVESTTVDELEYQGRTAWGFEYGLTQFTYTGPFTIGCDHGCTHVYPHAVGPTCSDDTFLYASGEAMEGRIKELVAKKSMRGIDRADVVFAWLGNDSEEAHGTLAEIGYAKGKGKKIIVAHMPGDTSQTWFAKALADKIIVADTALLAFQEAMPWLKDMKQIQLSDGHL